MGQQKDYSLSGRAFSILREDILKGKYEDGDELKEVTIGEELGVSRTPVREALRQLELEGLVEIIPNRGAFVTGITQKDVRDIYNIRSLLEGLCARWAAEHISEAQIEQLEEIILLSEYHLKKKEADGCSDQVVKMDGEFHKVLYQASNSRILEHTLSDFHKYVQMARKTSVEYSDRAAESINEHRAILDAIREKDAEKAEQLANVHILRVIENLYGKNDKEDTEHGKN